MLKTTLMGGVLFLIPFGILLLVLQEVLGLVVSLVEPIASLFSKDDYLGISLATIIAVLLIVLTCFLAGLATRYAAISGFSSKTDRFLAGLIPGYGMIRTRIASAVNNEDFAPSKQVVTLQVGGLKRFAFLIEEWADTDEALVFLPSSPNAEIGTLGSVALSDLTFVDIPAHKIHRSFQFYGRGLGEFNTGAKGKVADPKEQPNP